MDIYHIDITDSTNLEARRMLAQGVVKQPFAIFANYQTSGRGQGNHTWSSTHGKNLTVSITIKPQIKAIEQFYLTALTSISILQTVEETIEQSRQHNDNQQVKIKWINDVYVGDNKIAGILISNDIVDDMIYNSIIGIGLNINETDFPADIPNPTSLKKETGKEYEIEDILNTLTAKFESNMKILQNSRDTLREQYIEHLYKFNEPHYYTISGKRELISIRGIDEFGDIIR